MENKPLLIILGPTAVGKTGAAVHIAGKLNGEVISADSRQVFRGMDIGTGKDISTYGAIPYHLIDILNAGEKYNVNRFKDDFYSVLAHITNRNKLPVLCGGTGMYIHSLLQRQDFTAVPVNEQLRTELEHLTKPLLLEKLSDYPSEYIAHADTSSMKRLIRAIEVASYLSTNKLEVIHRPALNPCIAGLYMERGQLKQQIFKRLEERLENGMIEEVRYLLENQVPAEMLTFYGLEYKFITSYLKGELNYDAMKTRLFTAICQYAKRQVTFFKKMEKDGIKINWFDAGSNFKTLTENIISLYENTLIKA